MHGARLSLESKVTGQVKCETAVKRMRMSGQIKAIPHLSDEVLGERLLRRVFLWPEIGVMFTVDERTGLATEDLYCHTQISRSPRAQPSIALAMVWLGVKSVAQSHRTPDDRANSVYHHCKQHDGQKDFRDKFGILGKCGSAYSSAYSYTCKTQSFRPANPAKFK